MLANRLALNALSNSSRLIGISSLDWKTLQTLHLILWPYHPMPFPRARRLKTPRDLASETASRDQPRIPTKSASDALMINKIEQTGNSKRIGDSKTSWLWVNKNLLNKLNKIAVWKTQMLPLSQPHNVIKVKTRNRQRAICSTSNKKTLIEMYFLETKMTCGMNLIQL